MELKMYNDFSSIYDRLIGVDYKGFVKYYKEIFAKFCTKPKLLLDLGCGTGTLTSLMKKEGYDVLGVDNSIEMLSEARKKDADILFICQEMTELDLYGTVDAAYSSLDCINYILEKDKLQNIFARVCQFLNYGGLFIFDISSFYKLSQTLGNNTFVYDENNMFYTWENKFEGSLLRMNLTFFTKHGASYERIDEEQYQRAYTESEITELAKKAGFEILGIYNEFTFDAPRVDSQRIFFVMKRTRKSGV